MSNRLMRSVIVFAVLAAAAAAPAATVGKRAPAFTAKDIDGKSVSLAALRGKYVVLEWHNKDCPFVKKHYGYSERPRAVNDSSAAERAPARYASGNLPRLQSKWTGKGVVWLSIVSSASGSQGCVTPQEAREDIASTKTAVTAMLLDPDAAIARAYGAKCTPHMFVIDPKGVLIYNGAIDDHATSDAEDIAGSVNFVDQALSEAQAGKPVSVSSTRPYGCSVKYPKT